MSRSVQKVLILAGDTDGNIGDRAIVYAMCRELRRLVPDLAITLVSGRPELDRSFFDAHTVPRGLAGFPALVKAALASDLVLVGGGGLFQDDASLVKMPYWGLRVALARCLAHRVVGYSLGVGPLDWAVSRLSARLAFAGMREVSVRDELARALSQPLTGKTVQLVPDPALLLPPASEDDARRVLTEAGVPPNGTPVIGVTARRWFHHNPTVIPHKYAVKYGLRKVPGSDACARMVELLAGVLDRAVREHDASVLFLPTYNVAHEGDDRICEQVLAAMKTERKNLVRIYDPRLYKAVAGRLAVMLGSRMHSAIFAAGMGTPIVGLSYNQKFQGFFDLIGCGDQVITIADFVDRGKTTELGALLDRALTTEATFLPRVQALTEDTRAFTARILGVPVPAAAPGDTTARTPAEEGRP